MINTSINWWEVLTDFPLFLCHSRPVILNEVKNPLEADKRQLTKRIACEEILRFTQDDKQYVILNEVKNLKVFETVESSTNLEILRFTQDDKTVCHSERSEESPQSRQATTHKAYCQRGDPSRCSG